MAADDVVDGRRALEGVSVKAGVRQLKVDPMDSGKRTPMPVKQLRERSHDTQQQTRHRGILSGKGQALFFKPNVYASFRQAENDLSKIIQVAGQPIHRVANNGVAFAHIFSELLELGTVHVLPGSLIDKPLIENDAFELAKLFLIEGTHAQVADHLTGPPLPFCNVRFFGFHHLVSQYQKQIRMRRVCVTLTASRRGICMVRRLNASKIV